MSRGSRIDRDDHEIVCRDLRRTKVISGEWRWRKMDGWDVKESSQKGAGTGLRRLPSACLAAETFAGKKKVLLPLNVTDLLTNLIVCR